MARSRRKPEGKMKTRKIDFGDVPKERRKRGKRIPEGDYKVKIVKAELRKKEGESSRYYSWTFQVVERADGNKKHKGVPLYFVTSLKPQALFNLRNLILAATGKNVAGKAMNFDPKTLYGKEIGCTVEDDEYRAEGSKTSTIRSRPQDVFPVDELEADEEEDEDEDEDEEEEEDEDEDEDDEDDEDEDEDEDDELEDVDEDDV